MDIFQATHFELPMVIGLLGGPALLGLILIGPSRFQGKKPQGAAEVTAFTLMLGALIGGAVTTAAWTSAEQARFAAVAEWAEDTHGIVTDEHKDFAHGRPVAATVNGDTKLAVLNVTNGAATVELFDPIEDDSSGSNP